MKTKSSKSKPKKFCKYSINNTCIHYKTAPGTKCSTDSSCRYFTAIKNQDFNLFCNVIKNNITFKFNIPISIQHFMDYNDNYILQCQQYTPVEIDAFIYIQHTAEYNLFDILNIYKNTYKLSDNVTYDNETLFITIQKKCDLEQFFNLLNEEIDLKFNIPILYGCISIAIISSPNNLFNLIQYSIEQDKIIKSHVPEYITAIVICDIRKCIKKEHLIIDTIAKVKLAKPNGEIIEYHIPSAYCETCNTFYILKEDYKEAKNHGVLLCQIEDKTYEYISHHKSQSWSSRESRIHKLGYNVQQNNGYTQKQRQTVLAYIMENTDISKHEIKSIIIQCIHRHNKQSRYIQAVFRWREDLQFVNNYHIGNLPQVKINRLTIKGTPV